MSEQCRSRDDASRLRCERPARHDGAHRAETGEPPRPSEDRTHTVTPDPGGLVMTSELLPPGIREQAFMARRSRGSKRRAVFVRMLDLASTARDYVVLGFPEPKSEVPE